MNWANERLNVLILGGGPSMEHDVSLQTATMIFENLDRRKYNPSLATISKNGTWFLPRYWPMTAEEAVGKTKEFADIVFIALHGEYGEDGEVQKLFDRHNIIYTGSGQSASALGMHKLLARNQFCAAGLLVPPGFGFTFDTYERKQKEVISLITAQLGFPVVTKPVDRGSSVGVGIAHTPSVLERSIHDVFHVSSTALAEKYISGIELACGVLEEKNGPMHVLPPTEIIPKKNSFFDYDSKYSDGGADEMTPARIPPHAIQKAQQTAMAAHSAIGCSGYSRTDMMWDPKNDRMYVLEINTLPGLTQASILPKEAVVAGLSFSALLDFIVSSAF